MSKPSDIVGHKTFAEGFGFRHEPLTRAEADAILAQCKESEEIRAQEFPKPEDAARGLFEAWYRLIEPGVYGDGSSQSRQQEGYVNNPRSAVGIKPGHPQPNQRYTIHRRHP